MTVEQIIESACRDGVRCIELASGTRHSSGTDLVRTLEGAREQGYAFLVHNYFPVPEQPFVLNLASADPANLERSLDHVRHAINLAASVESPFYSFHCGFCLDPSPDDLGGALHGPTIPLEQALSNFVDSVQDLADYASAKNIDLLLENNVLSPINLGKVQLLGVTPEDIELLLQRIDRSNVWLLLDVGHLKVSAVTLDFDMRAAAARLAPLVRCCHLSDNDGTEDSNQVISDDAWFWEPLLGHLDVAPFWVLEAYNLQPQMAAEQAMLIEARVS
ncbi:MAG: TIM barrel protein [Betaproteobacteria bacterium]|nr:MAG: TIM barrel protein [Betaproteobacteria bacterium]